MRHRILVTGWPGSYAWGVHPPASGAKSKPFGAAKTKNEAWAAARRYLSAAKRNKTSRLSLKFCGATGGAIVPCGPGECFRIGEHCRLELAPALRRNKETLKMLLEGLYRDFGPMTPAEVLAAGTNRFGGWVGALLFLLARNQ